VFGTKTDARTWFKQNVEPRLNDGLPDSSITFDAFCGIYLDRWGATVAKRTKDTIEERLVSSRERFGSWTLRELEGAAGDVAKWRAGLTDSSRYRLTRAMRQTLNAAVRGRYLRTNPVADAGPNPMPRSEEFVPFTRAEIDAIDAELGPTYGPLVVFAAETGLRTNEWVALERRDVDKAAKAVTVQRRFADGPAGPRCSASAAVSLGWFGDDRLGHEDVLGESSRMTYDRMVELREVQPWLPRSRSFRVRKVIFPSSSCSQVRCSPVDLAGATSGSSKFCTRT
jgi:integrase